MRRLRAVALVAPALALALALALAACGGDDAERGHAEAAVRSFGNLAAPPERVRCERAEVVWGCRAWLADGRTQACQVEMGDGGGVNGVACQPIRGE
jgi:hypothetical protein